MSDNQPRGSRTAANPPTERQVPVVFVHPEDEPIHFVNAVAVQVGNFGEIILTLGQASAPILVAINEQDKIREFNKIRDIKAKTIARLAFTPASLQHVLKTIAEALPAGIIVPPPEEKVDDEEPQD